MDNFDVVVLGGGLAGLTLSLQLKQKKPDTSIFVLEKREGAALESTHKVGESTVELGTHYLRETLNLKKYLDKKQLPKHGLRFFFTPEHKEEIAKRVELGPRKLLPVPSHQLDRGSFENELINESRKIGNTVLLGGKVLAVSFDKKNGHIVSFLKNNNTHKITARWIVDATGRSSFLKRKLGLSKKLEHNANASWFRVKGEIDIDDWSKNKSWATFLEKGLRRLSTVHLMDKGYWVWLIPLSSGNTSVGVVADHKHHPFETFNTLEKTLSWLKKNEPLAFSYINKLREKILDFKVMKHYAHSCEKAYSSDRWAITGESGVFLDPFYSPGTDFIALNNTFISDIITRDLEGEDVQLRINIFERTHFALFDNWVPIYKDMYGLWGKTQTMVLKIFWDWATYWGVPTLLFTNDGYTNIGVLRRLFSSEDSVGQKFGRLNAKMQSLFLEWEKFDTGVFTDRYIDPFDVEYLKTLHKGIDERHNPKELIEQVEKNVLLLEKIAKEIFRLMSKKIYGTNENIEVNPYKMSLAFCPKNIADKNVSKKIKNDVKTMWFY